MLKNIQAIVYIETNVDLIKYIISKFYGYNISKVTFLTKNFNVYMENYNNNFNIESISVDFIYLNSEDDLYDVLIKLDCDKVLFVNNTMFYDINFDQLIKFHEEKDSLFTITGYLDTNVVADENMEFDSNYKLCGFYKSVSAEMGNIKNAGIYCIETRYFKNILREYGDLILTANFTLNLVDKDKIFVFPTSGNFIDSGEYNCKGKKKNKAFFIDRDGTINIDKGYVYKYDDFEFIEGVIKTLRVLKEKGYLLIVITNQSGIARGYYNAEDVKSLHSKVNEYLKDKYYFEIDDFYYCPHYSESNTHNGQKQCICRKPMPGMILNAAQKHNIDLSQSYMVGDKKSDKILLPELKFVHSIKDEDWLWMLEKLEI